MSWSKIVHAHRVADPEYSRSKKKSQIQIDEEKANVKTWPMVVLVGVVLGALVLHKTSSKRLDGQGPSGPLGKVFDAVQGLLRKLTGKSGSAPKKTQSSWKKKSPKEMAAAAAAARLEVGCAGTGNISVRLGLSLLVDRF